MRAIASRLAPFGSIARRFPALTVLMIGTGCAALPVLRSGEPGTEPVATAWPATLVAAHRELTESRHERADQLLSEFASGYAGTAEAVEAIYWRALIALDPANGRASPRDAAALLSQYLESRHPLTHRAEASVLHRLASSLPEPRRIAEPARAAPTDGSRDAEIQKLKTELEETKAELERIRKRLTAPATGNPPAGTPPPTTPPPTPPPGTPPPGTPPPISRP
jgi:hypothetical protein